MKHDRVYIFPFGVVKHEVVAATISRFVMLRTRHIVYIRAVRARAVDYALALEISFVCVDDISAVYLFYRKHFGFESDLRSVEHRSVRVRYAKLIGRHDSRRRCVKTALHSVRNHRLDFPCLFRRQNLDFDAVCARFFFELFKPLHLFFRCDNDRTAFEMRHVELLRVLP